MAGNFCCPLASVVTSLFLNDSTLLKSAVESSNQLVRMLVRGDASSLNTEGFAVHSTCGGFVAIEKEANPARQEGMQLKAGYSGNAS